MDGQSTVPLRVRRVAEVALDDLPTVDEHSIDVAAKPDAVFDAVQQRFAHLLSGPFGRAFARVWGCEPPNAFAVAEQRRPHLLVLAGKHRFSRYGIIFRITPAQAGATLSAESHAEFLGLTGRLYRAAVVGSGGHVVATRLLLRNIAATARRS